MVIVLTVEIWILLRYLLLLCTWPFSLLYAGLLHLRHFAYNHGYLRSHSFALPVLAIGNLHFGGTGKTPLVAWLLEHLPLSKVAVCARGYGRLNRAAIVDAEVHTQEADIGEELYFLKQKYPQIQVIAASSRVQALNYLHQNYPARQIVILDDALQHRQLRPSLSVLLCPYAKPYTRDYLIPSGTLRDIRASARRADIVILSKSPADLPQAKAEEYRKLLRLQERQALFFTSIDYAKPVQVAGKTRDYANSRIILVQGVARPEYLEQQLKAQGLSILHSFRFADHHRYQMRDFAAIAKLCQAHPDAIILSTEKDWPKLQKLQLPAPLFLMPISTRFLWGQQQNFLSLIRTHIDAHA